MISIASSSRFVPYMCRCWADHPHSTNVVRAFCKDRDVTKDKEDKLIVEEQVNGLAEQPSRFAIPVSSAMDYISSFFQYYSGASGSGAASAKRDDEHVFTDSSKLSLSPITPIVEKEKFGGQIFRKKQQISRASLDHRTKSLVRKIKLASSPASVLLRIEELRKHILEYPTSAFYAAQAGAVGHLLNRQSSSKDVAIKDKVEECLSLFGHVRPVNGWGLRLLSLDGGGTRGVVALEVLDALESLLDGRKISDSFDYMVGVSTGAIMIALLMACDMSISQVKKIYRKISVALFNQSRVSGAKNLILSHAYYDTDAWVKILRETIGEKVMLDMCRPGFPRVGFVSALVNKPAIEGYIFRNYNLPVARPSVYRGSPNHKVWQAVQASGAAPGYFQECIIDEENVHQDGGILANNPTAVGLHESRLLWPDTPIQCIISIGNGRFMTGLDSAPPSVEYSSLKAKATKIIDSASDTQMVHYLCNDLLDQATYFRFNPYMSQKFSLDENRSEVLDAMQKESWMYCRKNSPKLSLAAARLLEPKGVVGHCKQWMDERWLRYRSLM